MDPTKPILTGGCHCGAVRYRCEGPALMRGLCFCQTCQKISGGAGNLFMRWRRRGSSSPRATQHRSTSRTATGPRPGNFARLAASTSRPVWERAPGGILIKVGTLDDASVFAGPQLVTWTSEMQAFHLLPPGVPAHAEFPRPAAPQNPG